MLEISDRQSWQEALPSWNLHSHEGTQTIKKIKLRVCTINSQGVVRSVNKNFLIWFLLFKSWYSRTKYRHSQQLFPEGSPGDQWVKHRQPLQQKPYNNNHSEMSDLLKVKVSDKDFHNFGICFWNVSELRDEQLQSSELLIKGSCVSDLLCKAGLRLLNLYSFLGLQYKPSLVISRN